MKFYKFIHVTENNCYGLGIHKLESYLIIDNASLADAGEYTFNATNTFSGNSNVFTVIRSVDTIIGELYTIRKTGRIIAFPPAGMLSYL